VSFSDTSQEAHRIQLAIHRSMPGLQKVAIAYEMSMLARDLQRSRIIQEHPEWNEAQIKRELLRLAFLPLPLPAGLP